MTLNRYRVGQLLESFAGKKILIVGDIMVDEFIWGNVQRISPEAPVPVVEVMDETYRLGGSGYVTANIKAMGGVPFPIGVDVDDDVAVLMADVLHRWDIDFSCLT